MRFTRFAVISDTHIGAEGYDRRVFDLVEELRDAGYRIIFAGDIYDYVRQEDAFWKNPNIFRRGDIFINGNHDFFFRPPKEVKHFRFGITVESGGRKFYISHGDQVDFVWVFKWLKEHKGPWFIKLLSYLGRWKIEHYQRMYMAMEELPDWVVRSFEHNSDVVEKFRLLKWAYTFWKSMWKPYRPITTPPHNPEYDDYGGMVTFDPKHLIPRLLWFDKNAEQADTFVIGHLHKPIYGIVNTKAGQKDIYVLGAWHGIAPRTILLVENGRAWFHTI